MDDFLRDQWAQDSGRVFAHDHSEHGYVREVGNCLRLGDPSAQQGPQRPTRPADIDRLLGVVCKEPS